MNNDKNLIINVNAMNGQYGVIKTGAVKGAGELTGVDRTGNTYGMEAWVYVGMGTAAKPSGGVARLVATP